MIKNVKLVELNFKDDLIEYKCLCCNRNYQQKYLKSSNYYNKKFVSLFQKGLYPCEYMDD